MVKNMIVKYSIKLISIFLILMTSCFLTISCRKMSIDECFDSVFSIVCSSESRFDSVGSAFVIDNGLIITNAHIVTYLESGEYYTYEKVILTPNDQKTQMSAKVVKFDVKKDYAILAVLDQNIGFKGLPIGKTADLKIGDKLSTIGNLNNYGLCYNAGSLSAYKKNIKNNGTYNDYFQTNIEISKGSSGGPVLNSNNEVVGIMTFKVRDNNSEYVDGMSFFIPIESVFN